MPRTITGQVNAILDWTYIHIEENFRADNRGRSAYATAFGSDDINAVWYGEKFVVGTGPDYNPDFSADFGGADITANFDLKLLLRRFFGKQIVQRMSFQTVKAFMLKNVGSADLEVQLPFDGYAGATKVRPTGTMLVSSVAGWPVDDDHRMVRLTSVEPAQYRIAILGNE